AESRMPSAPSAVPAAAPNTTPPAGSTSAEGRNRNCRKVTSPTNSAGPFQPSAATAVWIEAGSSSMPRFARTARPPPIRASTSARSARGAWRRTRRKLARGRPARLGARLAGEAHHLGPHLLRRPARVRERDPAHAPAVAHVDAFRVAGHHRRLARLLAARAQHRRERVAVVLVHVLHDALLAELPLGRVEQPVLALD